MIDTIDSGQNQNVASTSSEPVSRESGPTEPVTLRESIASAMDAAIEKQERPAEVTQASVKSNRTRDEHGRFVPKESDSDVAASADLNNQSSTSIQDVSKDIPHASAPHAWSTQAKEKWANIPEDIRKEITKREVEIHRGFTKMDEDRNFGKRIKDVMTPYAQMMQSEGLDPVSTIHELFEASKILRTGTPQDKGAFLRHLAQYFNADLSSSQGTTSSSPESQLDPALLSIKQSLEQMRQEREQEKRRFQQEQDSIIQQTLSQFASDPAHHHFEKVRVHMGTLIQSGMASSLQDAYDQAVWAHPEIRSTLQEQQEAAREAKRVAESKARLEASKRAAGSINGSPGITASSKASPERSLRDEIVANANAFGL